jgi:hypothetical protein
VGLPGGRAQVVDELAHLDLGLAEDFVLGFADEQAGQVQEVSRDGLADARGQGLGLLFLLGG